MGLLSVSYKWVSITLDAELLAQQGLADNQKKIDTLLFHNFQRLVMLDQMEQCDPIDTKALKDFEFKIECLDFLLQEIWGFGEDKNQHRFWELPHCLCPDGTKNLGTCIRTINTRCPLHGDG